MKYFFIASLAFLAFACSTTKQLQMDPDADLSTLPGEAQCWLVDFEDVCVSLAENEDFADSEQLESDIHQAVKLLKEVANSDEHTNWYSQLSEQQSDRLQSLVLAIVVHYGVKHFVNP